MMPLGHKVSLSTAVNRLAKQLELGQNKALDISAEMARVVLLEDHPAVPDQSILYVMLKALALGYDHKGKALGKGYAMTAKLVMERAYGRPGVARQDASGGVINIGFNDARVQPKLDEGGDAVDAETPHTIDRPPGVNEPRLPHPHSDDDFYKPKPVL